MWHWVRDHRRKKLLETPFPPAWLEILERNVAHYARLDESDQKQLRDLTQVFVAEKHWEGCGGLTLTDEIRVTIAAQACLLILALPHELYGGVESIFVYPSTVVPPERKLGVFESVEGPVTGPVPLLGQAFQRGPVILAWDAVLRNARHPESGYNVVYHEFAHRLDMLDGRADGTPPLETRERIQRWAEVCSREFLALREATARGKPSFLDAYGAVSEAEFFAVATERFFDQPREMKEGHAALYEVLRDFYRQDPATSGAPTRSQS